MLAHVVVSGPQTQALFKLWPFPTDQSKTNGPAQIPGMEKEIQVLMREAIVILQMVGLGFWFCYELVV